MDPGALAEVKPSNSRYILSSSCVKGENGMTGVVYQLVIDAITSRALIMLQAEESERGEFIIKSNIINAKKVLQRAYDAYFA
jgi:hypothetical protein